MFNFFRFNGGSIFTFSTFNMVDGLKQSFFDDVFENDNSNLYEDMFYSNNDEHFENNCDEIDFIDLECYEDMYVLTINLKGINLRELSIRYDPGVIEINLYRLEMDNNNLIKKHYNKKFEEIDDIEIDNILKTMDDGFLSIRMFKKYLLNDESKIFDIEIDQIKTVNKLTDN